MRYDTIELVCFSTNVMANLFFRQGCIEKQQSSAQEQTAQKPSAVFCFGGTAISKALKLPQTVICNWAYGVVVSHPLRMRKALGSNPSGSTLFRACATRSYLTMKGITRENEMQMKSDTCRIRTRTGGPHRLSRPTP